MFAMITISGVYDMQKVAKNIGQSILGNFNHVMENNIFFYQHNFQSNLDWICTVE